MFYVYMLKVEIVYFYKYDLQKLFSDKNKINNNNNNNLPETIEFRVRVRWRIVYLMGGKNSSALGSSLSRDDISIKILVVV